ncbi:hypothetical protein J1N35_017387 [Gossypium stocksii]|uniref:Uncharacterized protein n=1 Tax=Gossypium stocksii TaxID=47602 RepID=A0A9D4A636_9ROSI|nr:hypothetical protein J1N35_017387 [Gossypium stocksii]
MHFTRQSRVRAVKGIALAEAGKKLVLNARLSILDSVLGNPRIRRLFSSGGPKKRRSVESFEEKLEEFQEALGIDPHNYVPVTYGPFGLWGEECKVDLKVVLGDGVVVEYLILERRRSQKWTRMRRTRSFLMMLLAVMRQNKKLWSLCIS